MARLHSHKPRFLLLGPRPFSSCNKNEGLLQVQDILDIGCMHYQGSMPAKVGHRSEVITKSLGQFPDTARHLGTAQGFERGFQQSLSGQVRDDLRHPTCRFLSLLQ